MSTSDIGKLEPVGLRTIWADEAQDFTPWLARNLDRLGAELNMDLALVGREATLPGAGRADILAKQVGSDADVVIENQLGNSDDDHCLRLLGYAANADANILVWVARRFTQYHRSILKWLNNGDIIDVYAVEVDAWRIGDSVGAGFRLVEGPQRQSVPGGAPGDAPTTSQRYASFYRPLTERLRRAGIPPSGRGGFRGRWRSFETGHSHLMYSLGLQRQGEAAVYFETRGAGGQPIFEALHERRAEIDAAFGDVALYWHQGENGCLISATTEAGLDDPEDTHDEIRSWMFDNLFKLRDIIRPYLDEILGEGRPMERDDGEVDELDDQPAQ